VKNIFITQDYDIVITFGEPVVRSQRQIQDVPVHFLMSYPVTVASIDKYVAAVLVCTATTSQAKARTALRAAIAASAQTGAGVTPAYVLTIMDERGKNTRIGGLNLFETPFFIEYTTGGP